MLQLVATTAIIQPIDNHNGILVLTEANAQYQIDTYHLAVIYNTTKLRDIYVDICSNYYTLKLKQNSSLDLTTTFKQINYLIDNIESKLLYLGFDTLGFKTSYRQKRGLINGLGSIIKSITGNLDQEDAMKIDNEIKSLKASSNNNKINQRKSISIMQNFMKDYENNLNAIKNNQIKIYRAIDRYTTRRNEVETNFLTATIFSQIENSLQQLYDRLETLENAITFSHLEKMHPSILDASYLIEELNQIQNEIKDNLAFAPNINNIHLWEKTIKVKAYSTNETLNFILDLPIVAKQPYNLLHLYSIPNNNDTILIPKNPYLILGNNEFAYPHEPCDTITENEVICKHLEWKTLLHSNDCIAQLIQHQEPHNCTYAKAKYDNNIIQQIKDNSWIVIMKQDEVIKTICNQDVQYQRSKGVFLITTDSNCKIQIRDRTLSTHQKYINIRETIPLPRAYQTPNVTPIKLKLDSINLDNLKDALRHSEDIIDPEEDAITIPATPSWPSITMYVLVFLTGVGVAVYKLWWQRRTAQITADPEPESETVQLRSQPSLRLHLKGGGVTSQ